jgi:hypothetical protein
MGRELDRDHARSLSSTVAACRHQTTWSDLSPIEDRICNLTFASGGAATSAEEELRVPFTSTLLQPKTICDMHARWADHGLKIIYFTL